MVNNNLDQQQLAIYYIAINQKQIEHDLQIKILNDKIATQKLNDFINTTNQQITTDWFHDKKIYAEFINFLQHKNNNNSSLEMTLEEYLKNNPRNKYTIVT